VVKLKKKENATPYGSQCEKTPRLKETQRTNNQYH